MQQNKSGFSSLQCSLNQQIRCLSTKIFEFITETDKQTDKGCLKWLSCIVLSHLNNWSYTFDDPNKFLLNTPVTMGRSKMPDRWLNYFPMKEIFYNERIIPIKVPLPLNRFLDPAIQEYRWTPADVMHRLPNLGMIIDTTYKSPPYYDSHEFTTQGIEYVKIMCAGHHVPSEDVYQSFCEAVRRFQFDRRNDGKIIALHCTHGINRTGYLLCRYLIEDHRYSAEEALYAFSNKRGYPVERENYIEELKKVSAMRRY